MKELFLVERGKIKEEPRFRIKRKKKTKTAKNNILTADPCVYYSEEQDGMVFKRREQVIGNTVYTVVSRNKKNAKATAFEITKKLIERNSRQTLITESLEGCNSGGNKQ